MSRRQRAHRFHHRVHGDPAGIAPTDAIEWTREHYCWHAIDTKEQERWVEGFAPEPR